ncbi:proline racemase family protein [Rhodococcus sp. NPDC056960]|uniref:proline racemase family protein n=1 Tax=Rhodococcus sp. NPDC056960 TaxID=3345982 RepID=UPI00363966FD
MEFKVIDVHSSGAPCRIVIDGLDQLGIQGSTMLEKKKYIEQNLDWFRTALLKEPRGNVALNADLVLPPCDERADVGLVILNQRPIAPLMSGGNILAFLTAILESGVVPVNPDSDITTVNVDTPAGLVTATAKIGPAGKVEHVTVANVPSYATHLDVPLQIPGVGTVTADIAYGGMFYALVEAEALGIELTADNAAVIGEMGERVRAAAIESVVIDNPAAQGLSAVDAVMIYGPPKFSENNCRNGVVMPMLPGPPAYPTGLPALIDRCPCGTGTSAMIAALRAKGKLAVGEEFRMESIIDEVYIAKVAEEIEFHGRPAIIPELTGTGWIIARADIVVNENDPLAHGFTVGDMWPGRPTVNTTS